MERDQMTPQQIQCVDARGGTILVSAAAGSGKTAVLIERLISRIVDDGVDVSKLLVVTFTNAAAAEMKQRLISRLGNEIKKHPELPRLVRQQMLLPTADINTMHAFCQRLIREHAPTLGLPVDFKLGDDPKIALLKFEALDELLEQEYEKKNPDFLLLSDTLNTKDDTNLSNAVVALHNFLRVLPDPNRFICEQLALYSNDTPFEDTDYGKSILTSIDDGYQEAIDAMRQVDNLALETVDRTGDEPPFFVAKLQEYEAAYAAFCDKEKSFDEKLSAFTCINPRRFESKYFPPENKEAAHALCDTANSAIANKVKAFADYNQARLDLDRQRSKPLVSTLFDLAVELSRRFDEKKAEAGLLDYNDLEHKTLELLAVHDQNGTLLRDENDRLVPTPLATEIAKTYDEIYVDEYQDTNEMQNALYHLLSQNEQNLFFVGDVKQSIYGFRHTSPKAFLTRRDNAIPYDDQNPQFPAAITLDRNFRSRQSVIHAVNELFCNLMHPASGGVDYEATEQLVFGAKYYPEKESELTIPSLLLIDKPATLAVSDEESDADADSNAVTEARLIAAEIKRLMKETVEAGHAPLSYSDFYILLRAATGRDYLYATTLEEEGIPAVSGGDKSMFSAVEIGWVLSLLRVIDNPLSDIALLSTLMSPIVGMTPDDMALIRSKGRYLPLYSNLRDTANEETALGKRCAAFLAQLDEWRLLAATVPSDRLLWHIYETTDLPARCRITKGGNVRAQNLRLLFEYAGNFEQNGFRGLSSFLQYVDRLEERGESLSCASVSGSQDAVRIMTIHGSKGLEAPVVFIANFNTENQNKDIKNPVLIHRNAGIAVRWFDRETSTIHTPIFHDELKNAIVRSQRDEELRLLYVAATRAQEKLYFVGTFKNISSTLDSANNLLNDEPGLSPAHVMSTANYSKWILASLLRHPDAQILRDHLKKTKPPAVIPADTHWDIRIVSPLSSTKVEETTEFPPSDEALEQQLQDRFAYTYPYESLSAIPVKLAASTVAHAEHDRSFAATAVPAFLRKEGLTAAEKGTATHAFMQYADWEKAAADVTAEKARLVADGKLSAEQADAVDIDCITAFFEHPLYSRITKADRVWRELPFTYALSVADYKTLTGDVTPVDETDGDETLVVQGIADCVFEEKGTLIILDYKTDRGKSMEALRSHYAPQLKLYAKALSDILGKPVVSCLLYSFANNDQIETGTEI